MTATILRFLLMAWKPILAVLAALGLYAKGRADAKAREESRKAKGFQTTIERVFDAPEHVDPDLARRRMRDRDPRQP